MGFRSAIVFAASLLLPSEALAQQQEQQGQDETRLARGYRTRALAGSAGHSWPLGWNDASLATSDLHFVGFHPQLGWFQTSRFELYGEATLHGYWKPEPAIFAGVMGIGARYHFFDNRASTASASCSATFRTGSGSATLPAGAEPDSGFTGGGGRLPGLPWPILDSRFSILDCLADHAP